VDRTDEDQGGLGSQRQAFDVPPDVAYFNTASLAPLLHSVRAAGESALRRRARPWTIRDEEWFAAVELLRSLFGRLVGGDADGVALVPATSYGLAVAANCIRLDAGQRILVLAEELKFRTFGDLGVGVGWDRHRQVVSGLGHALGVGSGCCGVGGGVEADAVGWLGRGDVVSMSSRRGGVGWFPFGRRVDAAMTIAFVTRARGTPARNLVMVL
jgi:hypothetical protein